MKNFAFTLAEVLITIGIIGVVAAMTIPNLQTEYRARKYRTQFNKSLSTIQQVALKMIDEGESLDPSDYSINASFYKVFAKHLNVAVDCNYHLGGGLKNVKGCFVRESNAYKSLDGSTADINMFDDGELLLQDGSLLLFENYTGPIFISVDIDGILSGPNIWGYDLFTFQLIDGKVLPVGATGTAYVGDSQCSLSAKSSRNGISCAYKVQANVDYFKEVMKKVKVR